MGMTLLFGVYQSEDKSAACACAPPKKPYPIYHRTEVSRHNGINSRLWVTFKNGVYDVTDFVNSHPGGVEKIQMAAGSDLSPFWTQPEFRQHFRSPVALELLEEMKVGMLHPDDVIEPDLENVHEADCISLHCKQNHVYKCIVVGAGLSGLRCAKTLTDTHSVDPTDILILEAQDYIGGRVRQMGDFVRGVQIDVGAEFIHGNGDTPLNNMARQLNEPLRDLFVWAQGDGGPLPAPIGEGYGLYCLKDEMGRPRLLRYDSKDQTFTAANEALHKISHLDPNQFNDKDSLYDYLTSLGLDPEAIGIANAGFANTLCTNVKELSMKRCVQWERAWHGAGEEEEEEDMDHGFQNSFKVIVDHLKEGANVKLSAPVAEIKHSASSSDPLAHLVMVKTKSGETYYAESLVVTSSPYVLKSGLVSFQPPLAPAIKEALDSTQMNTIVKVIMKFSEPVWPRGLRGMVMVDSSNKQQDKWLLPEVWFRDVSEEAARDEPAKAYAVGFTTTEYAADLAALPRGEVASRCVAQLDAIFSLLKPEHMAADPAAPNVQRPTDIKKPSDAFIGGMFWDWSPQHHPYIGGGYSSPVAGKPTHLADLLRNPYGAGSNIFFAGEATNMPGATADAALESGVRAAAQVAEVLKKSASTLK
jgi:monoamine oxidase/cytochrome b involved in lipid metabolism